MDPALSRIHKSLAQMISLNYFQKSHSTNVYFILFFLIGPLFYLIYTEVLAASYQVCCCSVLQCVAVCCSVLQCCALDFSVPLNAEVYCIVLQCAAVCYSVLQCAAVCCIVLQCAAVCCSVLQCAAVCCSVLQCVAVYCIVLQCAAVCCSVLQCAAVCYSVLQYVGRLPVTKSLTGIKKEYLEIFGSCIIKNPQVTGANDFTQLFPKIS